MCYDCFLEHFCGLSLLVVSLARDDDEVGDECRPGDGVVEEVVDHHLVVLAGEVLVEDELVEDDKSLALAVYSYMLRYLLSIDCRKYEKDMIGIVGNSRSVFGVVGKSVQYIGYFG